MKGCVDVFLDVFELNLIGFMYMRFFLRNEKSHKILYLNSIFKIRNYFYM